MVTVLIANHVTTRALLSWLVQHSRKRKSANMTDAIRGLYWRFTAMFSHVQTSLLARNKTDYLSVFYLANITQ